MEIYYFSFIVHLQNLGFVSTAIAPLTNVALGKAAYQTDTYHDNVAYNAVDGQPSPFHYCAHTYSYDAFWEVDLAEVFVIDHVIIYNRLDCCSDRLRNVEIYIGINKTNYVLRGYADGIAGPTVTFQIDSGVHGQWIKITRLNPFEELTLCEVIVMGHRPNTYTLTPRTKSRWTALQTAVVRNTQHCSYMCMRTVECASASFHKATTTCSLFNSSDSTPSLYADDVFMVPSYY